MNPDTHGAVEDVALEPGATDHGARRDGRRGVGEGELEQEEREERDLGGPVGRRHAVQEEVLVADQAVAVAELEGEAERPVEDPAQAGVEHALHQHVHGLPGPGEPGLKPHEPGLHEEDQEGGDQHPDRVDRAHEIVGRVGGICKVGALGRGVEDTTRSP